MRMTKLLRRFLSLAIVATLAATTSALAQDTLYRLVELRATDGASSKAYALNNTGQIVGWMESGANRHSAHWHIEVTTDLHGTVHFDLQHPYLDMTAAYFSQDYSEAYDISDADQIVGTARTEYDCPPKVLLTNAYILRAGVLTDLGTPYPGDALTNLLTLGDPCTGLDSGATGISNANHVVGWADIDDTRMHAMLVTPVSGLWFSNSDPNDLVNDLLVDLGTLPPAAADPVSSATAVNDAGQVTGYSYTIAPDGRAAYHAFLVTPADTDADGAADAWFTGTAGVNDLMTDLGTLGGANSWGRDINNRGQVVGESDYDAAPGAHYTRAFLWEDGAMTDLGTLGGDFSAASGINSNGDIVGWAGNSDEERHAFVYQDSTMKDLNDLLCLQPEEGVTITPNIILTEARDINDDGLIVGWGMLRTSSTNETRGFLLIPMDPNECGPAAEQGEDEDDDETDSGTSPSGDRTDYDGTPIVGTPANLGDGTPSAGGQEPNAPAGATDLFGAAPLQCGAGTAAFLPVTVAGLCWIKTGGRRLRRT